jgi:hypothetical protein
MQDLCEVSNAVSMFVPFFVTTAYAGVHGATFKTTVLLVGWAFNLPAAFTYHMLLAHGKNEAADIALRMDQSTQLLVAVCNIFAQCDVGPITLIFVAMCVQKSANTDLWDLENPLDNTHWARSYLIFAAVFTSCLPMIFTGNLQAFCVAVSVFSVGGAMLKLSSHPFRYTAFHFCLGSFAYALLV